MQKALQEQSSGISRIRNSAVAAPARNIHNNHFSSHSNSKKLSVMKNKIQSEVNLPPLRPYTKKELADIYQISPKVFRRWMKETPGLQANKYQKVFSVKEVK